ncbi:porin [Algibacillus agarilyticus]|uniref:porin n=1 Tax=Algibacillus agarilyticus TaxID=2234133 RepID=UPI001E3387A2|nr:porin [Algibacillus agarilyticus]
MKSTMKITLLASSIFATTALAAEQDKALTIYGKANLAFVVADEGVDTYSDIVSNASRIGATGEYKLDNGLTAIYKYEWQVNIDDKTDNLSARNQYLGVKGSYGEVVIGRIDTALKKSQGKIDIFSDYKGDIKTLWQKQGENRLENAVSLKSKSFNGFKAAATYITEASDDVDAKAGVSLAVSYGDSKLKKSKFYVAIASDSEIKGRDTVRLNAQAKFGALKVGGIIQRSEKVDGSGELDGIMVSTSYKISETTLKAQYQTADEKGVADKSIITLGVDYKLSSATKAYTWYSRIDNDEAMSNEADGGYLGLGLEHKF